MYYKITIKANGVTVCETYGDRTNIDTLKKLLEVEEELNYKNGEIYLYCKELN
ncbi:hypothetical protein [Robertmurraya siralis]|uniref:hypothetical protein n=1 Tax=Robertmurraya siralis TaxID=77777 RepID=UPI001477142D|nr:hypothetical protein [Robertmurraya siralis]